LRAQSFNLYGGFNSSNIVFSGDSADAGVPQALPGFHVGTSFNFKINDLLTFQPGIIFERKGTSRDTSVAGIFNSQLIVELYYLNIPLNLSSEFEISDEFSVYVSAGPYIGLGLFGNIKTEIKSPFLNSNEVDQVAWGADFQQFDFGFGLGAGLQYENFLLGLSYDFGIPNIASNAPKNNFARNRVFRISLGYRFDF
jgi:opacity protein-like surface antigen